MKTILISLSILVMASTPHLLAKEKNLVENGNFSSKRLKDWMVGVTNKYGKEIEPSIKKRSIIFSELINTSPKYLTLSQYIDIEPSKKYQLTFEAKISEGTEGKTTMGIGRPGFARPKQKSDDYDHLKPVKFVATTEWSSFSYDFTGNYKTDNAKAKKAGKKVKTLKAKWVKIGAGTDPGVAPTWIVFNLGAVEGEISLRNVKVVEVKE